MEELAPLQQLAVYGTIVSFLSLLVAELFFPKQKGFDCDKDCKGCEACNMKTFTEYGRVFRDKNNKIFYTKNNKREGERLIFKEKE